MQRVALDYLKPSNVTVGEFVPDAKPDRAPVPATVDVAALVKDYKGDPAAAAGETFDASPANLDARTQRFALPNGMKVALLPKKTRGDAVNFALTLHYADEKSAFGKQAVGALTGAMLLRGTSKRNRAGDRGRARSSCAPRSTCTAARPSASISGQTYRKELPDTLRLVAEVLRTPTFPADELDKLKREERHRRSRPRAPTRSRSRCARCAATAIRIRRATRATCPRSTRKSPTSRRVTAERGEGSTRSSTARATPSSRSSATSMPSAMRTLVTELFGGWKSPTAYARVPDAARAEQAGRCSSSKRPTRPTRSCSGAKRCRSTTSSPDYPALLLANYLLGDSPTSRLWERLRQKEGLSYGAGSFLRVNSFEPNSSLGVYAIFAPQNLDKVRAGLRRGNAARRCENGFTDAEVTQRQGRPAARSARSPAPQDGASPASSCARRISAGPGRTTRRSTRRSRS